MTPGSTLTQGRTIACRGCDDRVLLAKRVDPNPGGSDWIRLEIATVDPYRPHGPVFVLSGMHAWKPRSLTEQLQVARELNDEAADRLCRDDFPWHAPHICATPTDDGEP